MLISSTRVLFGDSFHPLDILIEDGIITRISKRSSLGSPDIDFYDNPILPGFIDVHTHGAINIDINHLTSYEDVDRLSLFFASRGVTSFLASVLTDTKEQTEKLLTILRLAIERGLSGASLVGIHLEGPFLCQEYKGAMPPSLILDGDNDLFDHYQKISGNNVRYITIAPESKNCMTLIEHIKKTSPSTKIAIGHSATEYEVAIEAIEKGAVAATHTFNAMKLFHMHRPAISGAVLERDEVYTEVICDGFHLHPATVRLILKTKGKDKVIAITDSIMASGLPDGRYKLGVNDVVVKDGDAKLLDGVRAGSTLTMDRALRNLIDFTKHDSSYLAPLMSKNAATMLSLSDRGTLSEGKRGDITVLTDNGEVLSVFVNGKNVFKREEK